MKETTITSQKFHNLIKRSYSCFGSKTIIRYFSLMMVLHTVLIFVVRHCHLHFVQILRSHRETLQIVKIGIFGNFLRVKIVHPRLKSTSIVPFALSPVLHITSCTRIYGQGK